MPIISVAEMKVRAVTIRIGGVSQTGRSESYQARVGKLLVGEVMYRSPACVGARDSSASVLLRCAGRFASYALC